MCLKYFVLTISFTILGMEAFSLNDSDMFAMSTSYTKMIEAQFAKKDTVDYDYFGLNHDDPENAINYGRNVPPDNNNDEATGDGNEKGGEDDDSSGYRISSGRRRSHHRPNEKHSRQKHKFGAKGCVLKIRSDFGEPQPIFVQEGKLLQINDKADHVKFKHNESLTISCPGKGRLITFNANIFKHNEAEAHCVRNSKFRVGKYWMGKVKHIECNSNPQLEIQKTDELCFHREVQTNIYKVGYRVRDTFHQIYHACFDANMKTTRYVYHKVTPKTKYRQHGGRRPYFTRERETFNSMKVSNSYNVPFQRRMINSLLGKDTLGKYINEKQFLARLQLAPRLDYIMRTEQRATYTYVNTVPQWKHIKDGDWAKLEAGLRMRAHELNSTLRVWTGTYGIWSAEGRGRSEHQIFLMQHHVSQSPTVLPVPLYVFKLVYLRCEMKATVFVSLNLPPRSNFEEHKAKVFCPDICHGSHRKFRWLDWTNHKSISFCCSYQDFASKVHVPKLEVAEIFH